MGLLYDLDITGVHLTICGMDLHSLMDVYYSSGMWVLGGGGGGLHVIMLRRYDNSDNHRTEESF